MSNTREYIPVACNEKSRSMTMDTESAVIQHATDQSVPVATPVPMMQVVAPATLPEGYEFEAAIGKHSKVKVRVPTGGVVKGQTFAIPYPLQDDSTVSGIHVPTGYWRDGMLNCFYHGFDHPHWWLACCCPLLAVGQVISRLKLTWYGRQGTDSQSRLAFMIIFRAVMLYCVTYYSLRLVLYMMDPHVNVSSVPNMYDDTTTTNTVSKPPQHSGLYVTIVSILNVMHWAYVVVTTVVLFNVRRHVRSKYAIPACSQYAEDCCCSFWCPCLVAAQMMRHTTDYKIYPATWCTETGVSPHTPSII